LKAQTYSAPGAVAFRAYEKALNHLKEVTTGRVDITLHSGGTLVPVLKAFDGISKGVVDVLFQYGGFDAGIDFGFAAQTSAMNLWPNPREVKIWLSQFGGSDIIREEYAKYNIHFVGPQVMGAEAIHSNVPLRTLDDFKGLKIRCGGGLIGAILEAVGSVPVVMGPGDIYSGLDTGIVDAAEYVTLTEDWELGLHEVGHYLTYPSFHASTITMALLVNMDVWNKLPDDLKAAIDMMNYEAAWHYDFIPASSEYLVLKKHIEYGNEHILISDADWEAIKKIAVDVAEENRAKSAYSDKIIGSMLDYLRYTGEIE